MISWFLEVPGRIYVVATLLPLAAFALLILGGAIRTLVRPYRDTHRSAQFLSSFSAAIVPCAAARIWRPVRSCWRRSLPSSA